MDSGHDCRLYRRYACRPHLYDYYRYGHTDHFFQGGHCDIQRTKPRTEFEVHKDSELVLSWNIAIFSLRLVMVVRVMCTH